MLDAIVDLKQNVAHVWHKFLGARSKAPIALLVKKNIESYQEVEIEISQPHPDSSPVVLDIEECIENADWNYPEKTILQCLLPNISSAEIVQFTGPVGIMKKIELTFERVHYHAKSGVLYPKITTVMHGN